MSRVEEKVKNIVEPILEKENFKLVDVEYKKEGSHWYLRVYIDSENGVTIEDCEKISRKLDEKMDEDEMHNSYILEVSSPGLDRPLKTDEDYEEFKGSIIDIKLYKKMNGQKEFQGELIDYNDKKLMILTEKNEKISFEKSDLATVRLAVIF